jgi:hypothetical protein
MNALVAANPGYQWDFRDGAVNLTPRSGALLLHTMVATFQKDATDRQIPAVLGDLLRLPEVRERANTLGLSPGTGYGGLGAADINPVPRQPVPIHVILQNLSLQDAFNKVVGFSPDGVWIYRETECNGAKTFVVEMRSAY